MEVTPRSVCCVNCGRFMACPILACGSCRSFICTQCLGPFSCCPFCGRNDTLYRDVWAEQTVILTAKVPCRFEGCFTDVPRCKMRQHEEKCVHRVKLCPLRDLQECCWVGDTQSQQIQHVKKRHPGRVFTIDRKEFYQKDFYKRFYSGVKYKFFFFFHVFNHFFQVYQCFDYRDCVGQWKVCYNGDRRFVRKFFYEVSFKNPSDPTDIFVVTSSCQLLRDQDFYYVDLVNINLHNLVKFCTGSDLFYKITIRYS
jgi:hypothetical protein